MERFISIYSNLSSWVGTFFVFLSTFFGGVRSFIVFIVLACLLDLVCGIIRSHRLEHKGVLSGRLVDFCWKSSIYILLFVGFVMVDKVIALDNMWLSRTYTAVIIFSEIISMLANLSVSFPKIKAFALIRKLIASEVSEKLKMDKSDVEDVLKEDKSK